MLDRIEEVQALLREKGLDGWLLYDFKGQNPTAVAAMSLAGHMLTRRWAYLVPAKGDPTLLVHAIEIGSMPARPGKVVSYAGWQALESAMRSLLAGRKKVAMEYCPMGAIPYLSRVDAGTLELVRSFGVEVVSSADLVQHFLCVLDDWQIESHVRAARAMDRCRESAYDFVRREIRAGKTPLEADVQDVMMQSFAKDGIVTDHPPIVAVNAHAGDPHYVPGRTPTPVREGDVLLLDLWGKEDHPRAVHADITWMAVVGREVPDRVREVWEIVAGARDTGVDRVRQSSEKRERLEGWQVDRAVRDYIAARGYGDRFVHRTGHNIDAAHVHGDGANLDDFETHDTRALVPGLCFSVEPGIYLPDFGIRSEIDVVLTDTGPVIHTSVQKEMVPLLG
jgi:Xaa-Pro aminopeptidase